MTNVKDLKQSLVELKWKDFEDLIKRAVQQGSKPIEILDMLRDAMNDVGNKFETGEYFISELIMAGEMMKSALTILKPLSKSEGYTMRGKVVVGTIEGDLHNIGKDIIVMLLATAGFEVYDLGIDVPPKSFVEKAKEVDAKVIGISTLLSMTVSRTAEVVKMLKESGMRQEVKVIIGGAVVRKKFEKKFGVDAAVNDAVEGLRIIESWMMTLDT